MNKIVKFARSLLVIPGFFVAASIFLYVILGGILGYTFLVTDIIKYFLNTSWDYEIFYNENWYYLVIPMILLTIGYSLIRVLIIDNLK